MLPLEHTNSPSNGLFIGVWTGFRNLHYLIKVSDLFNRIFLQQQGEGGKKMRMKIPKPLHPWD